MSSILSNVVLQINGETIGYMPNSLTVNKGRGETKNVAVTSGGNSDVVFSIDASTKIGNVKFDLPVTAENDRRIDEWKNARQGNSIRLSNDVGSESFKLTFSKAVLITNAELALQDEGTVSLEFMTAQGIG